MRWPQHTAETSRPPRFWAIVMDPGRTKMDWRIVSAQKLTGRFSFIP